METSSRLPILCFTSPSAVLYRRLATGATSIAIHGEPYDFRDSQFWEPMVALVTIDRASSYPDDTVQYAIVD